MKQHTTDDSDIEQRNVHMPSERFTSLAERRAITGVLPYQNLQREWLECHFLLIALGPALSQQSGDYATSVSHQRDIILNNLL
jgi:hypothetical protein